HTRHSGQTRAAAASQVLYYDDHRQRERMMPHDHGVVHHQARRVEDIITDHCSREAGGIQRPPSTRDYARAAHVNTSSSDRPSSAQHSSRSHRHVPPPTTTRGQRRVNEVVATSRRNHNQQETETPKIPRVLQHQPTS
ncbi:unnamed protein product, partial [Amoebophrya sp. A25]